MLTLMVLNLDLEVLSLFGELFSKRLEFEELYFLSVEDPAKSDEKCTNLLLPAFKLVDKEVVPLGNLGKLAVHSSFEVDKVLPCFHSVSGVLVPFANDFIEMTHRDLCHEGLLLSAAEDGLNARIATKLLAYMVHDSHNRVLVPPWRILNALDFTTHDDDLAGGNEFAPTIR